MSDLHLAQGQIVRNSFQMRASRRGIVHSGVSAVGLLFAVSTALGQCVSSFAPAVNYGVSNAPRCVAIGDLNGDGRPDLATANEGGNNVSIRLGNGDGTFQSMNNYGMGNSP